MRSPLVSTILDVSARALFVKIVVLFGTRLTAKIIFVLDPPQCVLPVWYVFLLRSFAFIFLQLGISDTW